MIGCSAEKGRRVPCRPKKRGCGTHDPALLANRSDLKGVRAGYMRGLKGAFSSPM